MLNCTNVSGCHWTCPKSKLLVSQQNRCHSAHACTFATVETIFCQRTPENCKELPCHRWFSHLQLATQPTSLHTRKLQCWAVHDVLKLICRCIKKRHYYWFFSVRCLVHEQHDCVWDQKQDCNPGSLCTWLTPLLWRWPTAATAESPPSLNHTVMDGKQWQFQPVPNTTPPL